MMKEYHISVMQDRLITRYGTAIVRANSHEEAKDIVSDMPQEELEALCEDWADSEESTPLGDIKLDY